MSEFKEKFIAYVDILGFKELVNQSETGKGRSLDEIEKILSCLGTADHRNEFKKYGPKLCPESPCINKDIDFQITQISDCVIVSTEPSPAGAINLVGHFWTVILSLLPKGIMCRGFITRGLVHHTPTQIIGSGYQNAYASESQVSVFKREADERGTPFIEIDKPVCDYINSCTDPCIKIMFPRMTKTDSTGTGLYPFDHLSHSFTIGGGAQEFNPIEEKKLNNNLRTMLTEFRDRFLSYTEKSDPLVIKKIRHYVAALEAQIKECDETDRMIDILCKPALGPYRSQ